MPGEQSASWLANAIYYPACSDVTTSYSWKLFFQRWDTCSKHSATDVLISTSITVVVIRDLYFRLYVPVRRVYLFHAKIKASLVALESEDYPLMSLLEWTSRPQIPPITSSPSFILSLWILCLLSTTGSQRDVCVTAFYSLRSDFIATQNNY